MPDGPKSAAEPKPDASWIDSIAALINEIWYDLKNLRRKTMPDQVIILPESVTEPVKAFGIGTREDWTKIIDFQRQALEVLVKATPTPWDDFILASAGKPLFALLTDAICKALGIP